MPVSLEKRPARCYMEFCCNTATQKVVLEDRSSPEVLRQLGLPPQEPIHWGWCSQHAPKS